MITQTLPAHLTCVKAAILDIDGVLWRGPQPIGDLPAVFQSLADLGWRVILATNNATRSPQVVLERLQTYGVHLEPWQAINSAQALARYLQQLHPQGGPVYVIGEEGLLSALSEAGFYSSAESPLAVAVGMDRQLTYDKLRMATLLIRAGAPFLATNYDVTFPTPEGLVPGAGAIVAAVETATSTKALVIGKPSPAMYQAAIERLGTTPTETLVVGDRLETDIAGGQALHCPTALVLSGVTNPEAARLWQPQPDVTVEDLTSLVNLWKAG